MARMEQTMRFFALVTLGVVLAMGSASASITERDAQVIKALFCDPENKEVAARATMCFEHLEDMPLTFFDISLDCCETQLNNTASGNMTEVITKYYCDVSVESMMRCNACQEERIEALHEGRNEIFEVLMKIGACFARAVPSE